MPIIGPIPNINRTNFAEFFVCPNFSSIEFELVCFFLDFFFFMKYIVLQSNFKRFLCVIESEKTFQFNKICKGFKKDHIV